VKINHYKKESKVSNFLLATQKIVNKYDLTLKWYYHDVFTNQLYDGLEKIFSGTNDISKENKDKVIALVNDILNNIESSH
jgi:hypothetical protein